MAQERLQEFAGKVRYARTTDVGKEYLIEDPELMKAIQDKYGRAGNLASEVIHPYNAAGEPTTRIIITEDSPDGFFQYTTDLSATTHEIVRRYVLVRGNKRKKRVRRKHRKIFGR